MESERQSGSARRKQIALNELAAEQKGVVTWEQLRSIGFSRAAIYRMVERGLLFRIHRGVYVVGRRALSRNGHFLAAVSHAGDDAALTGFAGAALAGFWNGNTSPIEVVVPRVVKAPKGIRVYKATDMPPTETRHGIRVTTPEHTILRLAKTMYSQRHFRRLVHEALVQPVTTLPLLLKACDDSPKRTKAVQRVERELADGAKPTRSGLEVDGPHHWTPFRKELDAYKQQLIEDAGVTLLRLGEDAATPAREPETVDTIRTALPG